MVGMGSVVTKSVPDFHLVLGSPARSIGAVCKCGLLFHKFTDGDSGTFACECGLAYKVEDRKVIDLGTAVIEPAAAVGKLVAS